MADSALTQVPSLGAGRLAGQRSVLLKALAVVAMVGLVASVAFYVLGSSSPRSAADRYLAAIQSGDSWTAWNAVQVDAVSSVDARLINQAAMAAALRASRPKLSGLQFVSANPSGSGQDVEYTYQNGGALQHLSLMVTKEASQSHVFVDPGWTVHLTPIVATVVVPGAGGGLTVDGTRVQVPFDRQATVAVLPLPHVFAIVPTAMLTAPPVTFDAIAASGKASLSLHASATQAAISQVEAAAKNTLLSCGSDLETRLATCYGLFSGQLKGVADSWSIASGPTFSDFTYDNGTWSGNGQVAVVFAYRMPGDTADRHAIAGGPFSAKATITQTAAKVTSLTSGGSAAPQLTRPAGATDSAAVSLVRAAMTACSAATILNPPDCPNSHNAYLRVDNVAWHLEGDPMQGAAVSWDAATGVLHVHGNYSMTASYDYVGFITTHAESGSDSSQYDAQLIWDGSALKLVTISPA